MTIFVIISVNKCIVWIYNDKNVKFFSENIFNIFLKACQRIYQFEKYYLVFKVIISYLEHHFLFISFTNSHLIVNTGKFKLDKLLSTT